MMLRTWSANADNEFIDDSNIDFEVTSREHATWVIAAELIDTASDDFLHKAMVEWVTKGSIEKLPEGNGEFWHVILVSDED